MNESSVHKITKYIDMGINEKVQRIQKGQPLNNEGSTSASCRGNACANVLQSSMYRYSAYVLVSG